MSMAAYIAQTVLKLLVPFGGKAARADRGDGKAGGENFSYGRAAGKGGLSADSQRQSAYRAFSKHDFSIHLGYTRRWGVL